MEKKGPHLPPPPYRPPPPPPPAFAHLSVEGFSARLTVIVDPVQTGAVIKWRSKEMDLPLRRQPYMAGVELTQEASLLLAIVIKVGLQYTHL